MSGAYWTRGSTSDELRQAWTTSPARVGAIYESGRLVACARALSDGTRRAWIYDVVVEPALRGRGVGEAVMRLLLDHPLVRNALSVRLGTRDATRFYERQGFREIDPSQNGITEMVLRR